MAFEAELVHGSPLMIDHTPGSAVVAGEVVIVGETARIAHLDIVANVLGALAARGGVYKMPKATGASTAIAAGKIVYWKEADNTVTETKLGNDLIGITTTASVDGDTHQEVEHQPDASVN